MTYPDVLVACPPFKYADEKPDTLLNPRVIVEVLSDSTESFDRGEKMLAYREIPSLTDYLLIAQTHISVEHYSRQPDGRWIHEAFTTPESVIEIPSIECSLTLTDVYDKVDFSRADSSSRPPRRE
jgi:Uma2 family endonuclease